MARTHHYANGRLTINWQPEKCIHSGICVHLLPKVYDPKARPWIRMENADDEALMAQIDQCPSGALSYIREGAAVREVDKNQENMKIEIAKNGPYLIKGPVDLVDSKGNTQHLEGGQALCRCGASHNKPFCDGTHRKIGFDDAT